ncbi:MAG: polyprenyl diphosphate synthase [Chloroflexi bacterium]|nr:polyprenyl diphosphate synthase [Chloroflexota bacterium]MDA1218105.1 polyprenyl diphosphate synthase [Chloroflexota bacterium]PKB57897.1 MAG: di-trans,poly-cis-decaprenylcistransferase [SAR202 cluster bacterium Casp-Chloro-G3]
MQAQPDPTQQANSSQLGIPQHVAFIMDGNGRWAAQRGLPRLAGHKAGVDRLEGVLEFLANKGVKYVTVYAFSTENWNRPAEEVQGIMELLGDALQSQTQALHEKNVRVRHIGRSNHLSPELGRAVDHSESLTENNTGITLNVAFDYGSRDEILEAARNIVRDGVPADAIDETLFTSYLYTAQTPDPDLIVRTGGELRLSNFLLWQSAYSEYYHTPVLWPDLDEAELGKALDAYQSRQRRFGKVSPNSQA